MAKQYRTRRNLLHRTKLDAFVAWAQTHGYILHPRPAKAIWEVARLEEYTPSGNNPHIVFYTRLHGDHLTCDGEGVELVKRFLKETKP